jgi:tetratricopeptide (TPR) repeat protein
LLNTETLSELKDLVEKNPCFQPAWMLYLKNLKKENSQDFEKELKRSAIHISERKLLFRFLHNEENAFKKLPEKDIDPQSYFNLESEKEETHGDSLIDKFLSSKSPSIRRNYTDSGTQADNLESDVAKNSLSEDDEMVTETLAMLYYQQKKYDKALDAFKKLSLKYPEKSVYFATRIEEIEKLKNI